jgi:IclR family KDG regulon transcriptional repressor
LGRRLPLWAGAVGKAILANIKETEKKEFFNQLKQQGLPTFSSGKILDLNELRSELVQIQKDGCAISISEREQGTSAVASPIFNIHNEVIGAVNIAGPTNRFKKEVLSRYCSLIKKTANLINQKIRSEIRFSV